MGRKKESLEEIDEKKRLDAESIKQRYRLKLEAALSNQKDEFDQTSSEYKDFVGEFKVKKLNIYEKLCFFAEKYAGVSPDIQTQKKIEAACSFAYLNLTPKGVYSFGILAPIFVAIALSFPALLLGTSGFFLVFLILIGAVGSISPLLKMPTFLADSFRMKASNQMVLAVFYLVTYMRHTSNLERAVEFAATYLGDPMSYELKKVLWDVETGNFDTITASLENFLEKWRDKNPEFVDAVHLIESSLLETSNQRRLEILDKSLDVILDETYEKMLHFAHNLQSPITTLHMLGIILPILGLVILPLMLSFMEEVKWYHISVLYNVFLPAVVFFIGQNILSKRPSGYGSATLNENNKEIKEARKNPATLFGFSLGIPPLHFAVVFVTIFVLIGLFPLFMSPLGIPDFGWGDNTEITSCGHTYCFLEYREQEATLTSGYKEIGPYGLGSSLVGLLIILGIGVGIGVYYKSKSMKLIGIMNRAKRLEDEFSSALFQLGNKLGDNLPAEIATMKVAESLPGTQSGNFFKIVTINVQKLGMSVSDAIFNPNVGALIYYPSQLIESSMKVLIQAVQKGPLIASNALINISRYVKEMHKVEERLTDLMAEVISSMKSQIGFLMPIIAAIVVGITSMIATIIGYLSKSLSALGDSIPADSASQMAMVTEFFKNSMPTYYFQLIVGIYIVQITIILTILINSIQNGSDKVRQQDLIGRNLVRVTIIYVILSAIVIIVFNYVASAVMPASGFGF